jgi:hypothetical protein
VPVCEFCVTEEAKLARNPSAPFHQAALGETSSKGGGGESVLTSSSLGGASLGLQALLKANIRLATTDYFSNGYDGL